MNQDLLKKIWRQEAPALRFIEPGMLLGVGSGSTVSIFIDVLKAVKGKIDGAVASSTSLPKN